MREEEKKSFMQEALEIWKEYLTYNFVDELIIAFLRAFCLIS
jgi:hypothetical protein